MKKFPRFILGKKSTCFGQFLCPSSAVFHCTHSNGICHTACEQDQDGTAVPSWSCSQAVSKPVWHVPLLYVQWKTPDDGQRYCPKHVEFYSTNKFEKLVHLVGFVIRIFHDVARSAERQNLFLLYAILGFTTVNYLYGSLEAAAGLEIQLWRGFNNRLTKTSFSYTPTCFPYK